MTEPLDNLYHLEEHHNKLAYNSLMKLPPIKEALLWSALPISKNNTKGRVWTLIIFPSLAMAGFLMEFAQEDFSWLVLGAVLASFVLLGASTLWLSERERRRTFYGISATTLWVKKNNLALQQYHIPDLTKLKVEDHTISYATIINNSYQKHILMEEVPHSQAVYELLVELQQKKDK